MLLPLKGLWRVWEDLDGQIALPSSWPTDRTLSRDSVQRRHPSIPHWLSLSESRTAWCSLPAMEPSLAVLNPCVAADRTTLGAWYQIGTNTHLVFSLDGPNKWASASQLRPAGGGVGSKGWRSLSLVGSCVGPSQALCFLKAEGEPGSALWSAPCLRGLKRGQWDPRVVI